MMATSLDNKGQSDTTARKLLTTTFLELLGRMEVALKSDGEHTLVQLKKAGKDAQNLKKVLYEESPAGESRANGEAEEAAVREVKWRIRAIILMLEKKFGH